MGDVFQVTRAILIGCATLACLAWPGTTGGDEGPAIPETIEMGDVAFPHALHVDALELSCGQCHHETDAAELNIPHPEYFEDFWIDCATCHQARPSTQGAQTCSSCHRANPFDIADETLSAKVVIHRSCWTCHDVGTGQEASKGCAGCHAGKRSGGF